jgi:hypothetical protein
MMRALLDGLCARGGFPWRALLYVSCALTVCSLQMMAQESEWTYRLAFVQEAGKSWLNRDTPLNRNNTLLAQPETNAIHSATFAGAYGIVTGSVGWSVTGSDLIHPAYAFTLHELSIDVPITEQIDLLAGKKILKWGTGYAFNPTGVVEPQRLPSDPSDRLNANEGRKLVSISALSGQSSLTIVYLNDVKFSTDAVHWANTEWALRASTYVSGLDLAFIGHWRQHDRGELGVNSAYVIGERLELHAEALASRGTSEMYHASLFDNATDSLYTAPPYRTAYGSSSVMFWKTLIGGQYTFDNGVNIVLEYYHNGEGLSRDEWDRWMTFVRAHDAMREGSTVVPTQALPLLRVNLLWALQTLASRGTMREYVFVRGAYTQGAWSGEVLGLVNAVDKSSVVVTSLSYKFSPVVTTYMRGTIFSGRDGTEYGSMFVCKSFQAGFTIQH